MLIRLGFMTIFQLNEEEQKYLMWMRVVFFVSSLSYRAHERRNRNNDNECDDQQHRTLVSVKVLHATRAHTQNAKLDAQFLIFYDPK